MFKKVIRGLFILAGISAASVLYPQETPAIRVAVLDIVSRVKTESIDTITFSEKLQSELLKQKAFIIVERSYLSKILEEQKLELSGITESDATKIGKLAHADKIVTGSLGLFDGKYMLVIKLINTSSGVIEDIEESSGDSLRRILDDIPEMADDMVIKAGYSKREQMEPQTNGNIIRENLPVLTKKFSPIQLGIVDPIQMIPRDYAIYGLSMGLSTYDSTIIGFQVTFFSRADRLYGWQTGFYNEASKIIFGWQAGFVNNCGGKVIGTQWGFINYSEEVIGLQLGFLNQTKKLTGAQIGLVNIAEKAWIPFMIGINVNF